MKFYTKILIACLTVSVAVMAQADPEDGEKGKAREAKGERGKGRPQPPRPEPPKFADLDTDSSGGVSKEEWIAHQVKMAKERGERSFPMIDRDESGDLSEQEINAMMQRFRGRRPGGDGDRPGKGRPDGKGRKGGDGDKKRPALEE